MVYREEEKKEFGWCVGICNELVFLRVKRDENVF